MPEIKRYKATVTAVYEVVLSEVCPASEIPGLVADSVKDLTVEQARTVSVEVERT